MRVLVTGGAGFIGSHFARRLAAAGEEVVVLDKLTYSGNRANLEDVEHELHVGDIADADAVRRAAANVDAVVNFAAETHVDRSILEPEAVIRTNVLGPHVLLEWARESGKRLLQVSTDEVYGDVGLDESARTEEDQLRPSSPYSAAKAGGDLLVPAYVRTYGIDALRTHGANTYGPKQYPEKFLPLFVTNLLDGEPVPVYGDGRQRREWLFVEDHCAAIELVLREGSPGEAYNVGGEEQENLTMVAHFLRLTGAGESLVRHVEDRAGHDRRYAIDDTKLRGLGWTPATGLERGLEATVAWYREHRSWWEPIKSGSFREYYEKQYASRLAGSTA
ncbi:MAG TPA: dTDP-glucose 4,6-dehydratase [Gaiellaceae bacterium]|nr:dTDP-glucose 4,6-dehydratase [Gaiellaceae bacterium]